MEKLTIQLYVVDTNGNMELQNFIIKVSQPKDITEKTLFGKNINKEHELVFSLKLPKHYREILHNITIYRNRGIGNSKEKQYTEKLPIELKAKSLIELCQKYNEISNDCIWLYSLKNANLKKVIFIKSKLNNKEIYSYQSGITIGTNIKFDLNYEIGYIDENNKRYNKNKQFVTERDTDFYKLNYIEWSTEEEQRLMEFSSRLVDMLNEISSFTNQTGENFLKYELKQIGE
jgi:hypothetical protein